MNVYLFQPQYKRTRKIKYWLPYAVSCIWSYCNQFPEIQENYVLKDVIFKREDPQELLERLDNPTICAFSTYVWNEQYCLGIAKLIKEKFPNCIIEFGGPQACVKMQNQYDFIDTIIVAEGEESFYDILTRILNKKEIPKVYDKKRLESLDYPSPYQSGIFDMLVRKHPDYQWATTLETNRGCPHRCTFCDWGGTILSSISFFDMSRVEADLEWIRTHNVDAIFLADANFGMFRERDLEIAALMKRKFDDNSCVREIILQYAKNSTEVVFKMASLLDVYTLRGITISVQSVNQPTLKAIKRKNLHINNLKSHMELSQKYNVKTYTEMILGLPEETLESWKDGISLVMECGQHNSLEVWFCQLLNNSELATELSKNLYGIESVKALNYMPIESIDGDTEDHGFVEYSVIVNKTNTMSTEEMIEAYMYFWVIRYFHYNGHTKEISKNSGMSYRKFYEILTDVLLSFENPVRDEYFETKDQITQYLNTGTLSKNKRGHNFELYNINDMSLLTSEETQIELSRRLQEALT
ncbi:radical SAM protein [archaeon]|nr:radical SAM protein [archaeon]